MGFTPSAAAQLMEQQRQQPGPLDIYAKAQQILAGRNQLETQRLQQQGLGLQNQKEQMNLDSQKKLMDAISSGAFNKFAGANTSDGSGFDAAGAYQELVTKHGVLPEHAAAATESLLKIGQSMAEQRKTNAQAAEANVAVRSKTLDALAAKLGSIGDMPANKAGDALEAFHQDLVNNPKAYPGLTQEEMAHLYSSELGHLPAIVGYLGLEGKLADFHKSKAEAAAAQQKVIPEGGGLSPDTQQQVAKDVAINTNPQIQTGKVAVATAEGKARAQAQASLLTGDALDQSADRYLQTGQLPAGMRSPGMSAAIINRAGERGAGQSIAANTAAYTANKQSYDNVTKTLDTLSGFETAAGKNIDMFRKLTSKLPDIGVPWLNTPLRLLDEKAVGAEWMPAINAAREIANREVARVTNDPKLSGVLSDSARQEVSSLNPKDATLAQIMHVTDLMKQDMANVHTSLNMQKADIEKRLGITPGGKNTSTPNETPAGEKKILSPSEWLEQQKKKP